MAREPVFEECQLVLPGGCGFNLRLSGLGWDGRSQVSTGEGWVGGWDRGRGQFGC